MMRSVIVTDVRRWPDTPFLRTYMLYGLKPYKLAILSQNNLSSLQKMGLRFLPTVSRFVFLRYWHYQAGGWSALEPAVPSRWSTREKLSAFVIQDKSA